MKHDRERGRRSSPDFFVVGSGRSGTTLFRVLLSKHSDVDVPDESGFILRAYKRLAHLSKFTEVDYAAASRIFCQWSIGSWGLNEQDIYVRLCQENPQTYRGLNDVIYGLYYEQRESVAVWGIKRPIYIIQLERLMDVYPDCPIIHIVRDVRDTYLSFKKVHDRKDASSFGPKNCVTVTLYWRYCIKRYQVVPAKLRKEIRYEDIIDDPDANISEAWKFLGVKTSDKANLSGSTVMGKGEDTEVDSTLLNTIHEKLQGPVDSNNQGKYITEMNPLQIFISELIGGDLLTHYGYEMQYGFLASPILKPLRMLCDLMTGGFYKARYFIRDYKIARP